MASKAAPIFRSALTSDVLGALDFAESVYRGMQRTDAEQLGMTDAEYGVVPWFAGSGVPRSVRGAYRAGRD